MGPRFAQGNITTQNLNPNSGVPTAGSFVQLPNTQDYDTIAIQVTGTYTGALSLQATIDGTNWKTLGGPQAITDVNTAAQSANIASATQSVFQADVSGFQAVRITALAAVTGTAVVSIVGTLSNGITGIDTPITLVAGQTTSSNPVGIANNLTTTTAVNSAASTNAANVKTSNTNLYSAVAHNTSAATKYIRFYNKGSAPVPGTDTPIVVIAVPASSSKEVIFGAVGMKFASGLGVAITNAAAVLDATVVAAGDVQLAYSWI